MTPQIWNLVGLLLLLAMVLSVISFVSHEYGEGPPDERGGT